VPIGGTPGKPADNFVNFLNAQIVSDSTKVLASPTLILSENADELRKGEDNQGINIANLSRGGSGDSGGGVAVPRTMPPSAVPRLTRPLSPSVSR